MKGTTNRGLRILIAPGPFKENLTASQVARAMERGVHDIKPDLPVIVQPLCDGGTGFCQTLIDLTGGSLVKTKVTDPLYHEIEASYGILGNKKTAIIESAAAAGLALVPEALRDPLSTSTFGVGELVRHAVLVNSCSEVIVGCGDSATNDCGIGCAAALGVQFKSGREVISRPIGGDLLRISSIDESEKLQELKNVKITVACNLTSILSGAEGTTRIYARQKGATPKAIELLATGVEHFVDLIYRTMAIDIGYIPGIGGAGGLAAALYIFFGARLQYSFDVVDRYAEIENKLEGCDLVLTGEGCIDDRTATGKVACALGLKAKKQGIPVIAISGMLADDHEDVFYNGIDAVECLANGPLSRRESMQRAEELIRQAAARVLRFVCIQ